MRDKNGRFTKKVQEIEGLPEKWTILIDPLTADQKTVVGKFFADNVDNCYRSISIWRRISSHNNMDQCVLDKSIARKMASFADGKEFEHITFEQFEKYVLKKDFTLPKEWYLKITDENISTIHKWRTDGGATGCSVGKYILSEKHSLSIPGKRGYCVATRPTGTEITFEQFKKYVLKEEEKEFVLPEKWCIKKNCQEVADWCKKKNPKDDYTVNGRSDSYAHSELKGGCLLEDTPRPGYTEITLEQFKKHVLKQGEKKMEKKIIGYKLIKEYPTNDERFKLGFIVPSTRFGENGWGSMHETCEKYPEFWKPVYEDEVPNISIKGYKAEFRPAAVTFGCKTFTRDEILKFVDILDRSGLTITTFHPEVKKVAEYFKNQK